VIAAVIDCSAVAELLTSAGSAGVREHDELGDCLLAAPHLIDPEFVSVVRRLGRSRPQQLEWVQQLLDEFASVPITRFEHGPLRRLAWDWRHELSAYDAMYVALAHELRVPLVTSDARLAAAAGRWCEARLLSELAPSAAEGSLPTPSAPPAGPR